MSVTFQTECFAKVCDTVLPLAKAHWNEVEAAMYGEQQYTLNTAQYTALEQAGLLHLVTARGEHGQIAGYASFLIVPCQHKPGVLMATLDALYLVPSERVGLCIVNMVRCAETTLRERGVAFVQYSSPASRPCDALYRRLGAKHTETIWYKELV